MQYQISELSSPSAFSIKQFYSGKSVLVTGCTGLLGKAILEKLLRSCPDIKTIFVLVRGLKGKDPYVRFNEQIVAGKCFDLMRS